MSAIENRTIDADEAGMRLDRWFKIHFPGLGFGQLQKLLRTGQIRLDGSRAKSDTRVREGQTVRVPPLAVDAKKPKQVTSRTIRGQGDGDALSAMLLHEDEKVLVINKPAGIAVQGGSGITRHIDGMLEAWRNKKGEKPRLVHRIDRDTSGILVIARTRQAAVQLTKAFRQRATRKTYWAIVKGVPKARAGRISTYLVRVQAPDGDRMRVVPHGTEGAEHAVTTYRVIDQAGRNLSWLELEPQTGRMHQLRAHAAHIGCPIIGDPKYFEAGPDWQFPGGVQKRLHLHARHIAIPHPDGGMLEVTAPLPPHMIQTFNLLGFDESAAEDGK